MARRRKRPVSPATRRVQGLRFGNAATKHGKGYNRGAEQRAAIRDQH